MDVTSHLPDTVWQALLRILSPRPDLEATPLERLSLGLVGGIVLLVLGYGVLLVILWRRIPGRPHVSSSHPPPPTQGA